MPSGSPRCSRHSPGGRARAARLPHLRRLAEPERGDPVRGPAGDGGAGVAACRGRAGAGPRTSTSAAASGFPTSTGDEPLDLAAIGDNLAGLLSDAIRPNLPDAGSSIELGRYIVGECGVYVTRIVDRKRSRGQDLPRRRRRPAPPARGVGQLRPGDPPQLSRRDRAPAAATREVGQRRRLSVHAARPARRRGRRCRGPRSATWSSSSRRAPMGSPPARPAFLGHPAPAEVLVYMTPLAAARARGRAAGPRRRRAPRVCWRRPRSSIATPAARTAARAPVPRSRAGPQRGGRDRPLSRGDRRRPAARRPGPGGRRPLHRRDRGDRAPLRRLGARTRARGGARPRRGASGGPRARARRSTGMRW